jgi:predicted nucleotidyltransferase
MNHRQRVDACREISSRLLQRYPEDIVATAVFGSVARGEDLEHSDIDFQVLVRERARLSSHFFVLDDCFFSIVVKTEESWRIELTEPESGLCLSAGSLIAVLPIYDPSGAFARLKTMAKALPQESWKSAIREGIAGIVEDLGRVRNMYEQADYTNFRLFSVLVAIGMAKVYGDLGRRMLKTDKDLNRVFEESGGPECEPARAYRVAARLVEANDHDTMDALEWLNDFLMREALKQSAMPQICKSARSYIPP